MADLNPPSVTSTASDPRPPEPALRKGPEQLQLALILALAFVLNLVLGSILELLHLRWGLILSQTLFIAGPAILALRLFYLDPRAVLPVRRPSLAAVGATLVGTAGLNHLLNLAGEWQERFFPTPEAIRSFFEAQFIYRGPVDFVLLIIVFAIVPAICEETLFRGFVLAGFARIFESGPIGITLTALVFAVFHLDPWRFIGVFLLGLFLGFLARATGSLLPSMLCHAMNNVLSISQVALSRDASGTVGTLWSVAAAGGCVALAVVLLRPGRPTRML
jgi:membrane protease YdiL (CAAX protease family)